MPFEYRLTDPALADLRAITAQIAESSPNRAERWERRIFDHFDSLRNFPYRCPKASESQGLQENVRYLMYGKRHSKYRILFVVRGEIVLILAIRHAARGDSSIW